MTWPLVRLGDVVSRLTNGFVGATRNIYIEEGVPYLLARQVKNNILKFDGKTYVSDEFNIKNKKSMLIKGDVLLVQSGHIGHSAVVPAEHEGHNCHAMIVMTPKEGLKGSFLSLYFHYLLLTGEILEIRTGSTVPHLTCKLVKELLIPYPPIPEQKRIVAILDQVFADIEQARAKTEQNLKSVHDLYLSKKSNIFDNLQSVAKLMTLPSVCDEIFAGGDAPKKGFFSKDKTEQYRIPIYANAVKCNGLYGFTDFSRANKPSITIAARGSGTGHIELRRGPFLPIVRLVVLTPVEEIMSLEYLKHALQNLDILRSGSAIPQLTVPMIKEYSIPVPSLDNQQVVVDELERLGDHIEQVRRIYEQKIGLLEELKKSILQKAFTGELTKTEIKGAAA